MCTLNTCVLLIFAIDFRLKIKDIYQGFLIKGGKPHLGTDDTFPAFLGAFAVPST